MKSFNPLFHPNSIAIVGAHTDPTRLGYVLAKNLRDFGYKGRVYLINPKFIGQELFGYRFYSSISDAPDEIDLALMLLGAKSVLPCLKECIAKGVKSATIFAAGFAEVSAEDGKMMELEIEKMSKESSMVIVGPNCLGVISVPAKVCTFPEADLLYDEAGRISAIFQSGSLLASFEVLSSIRGFHLNKGVSTGNEAATTLNDFLEYFIEDPETHVIAMYIEQVRNSKKFVELCKSTTKPIVALKIGRSEAGRRAAKSHTAALAGSIEVWGSLCKQVGIIQAKTFFQLYDYAMALAAQHKPKGNNIGIVTAPGGPSVIATDICGELGINVPRLKEESVEKLRKILPSFASLANPIDMTASALENLDVYKNVMEIVASDPNIDAILTISSLTNHLRIAKAVVEVVEEIKKPIVVSWTGLLNIEELREAMNLLGKKFIPNYFMPERAVEAIAVMLHQSQLEREKAKH